MVTDWVTNPDVALIAPLLSALVCALVLASASRRLPASEPRWRLARAVFICLTWAVEVNVVERVVPFTTGVILFSAGSLLSRGVIYLTAFTLGRGLLMAWLIPWLIEGRTLYEMGWVRKGWIKYVVVGLAVGLVLGLSVKPEGAEQDLLSDLGAGQASNLVVLATVPWQMIVTATLWGLAVAWSQENVFRGHLLPSLREAGVRGAWANVLQSLAFAACHPVAAILLKASEPGSHLLPAHGLAAFFMWFLWGLLFGVLRIRTKSIVLPFALHAAYDAMWLTLSHGPTAIYLQSFRG